MYQLHRRCTDVLFLGVLVLFTMGMACVGVISYTYGDHHRILRGTDLLGNTCGVGNQDNIPSQHILENPDVAIDGDKWRKRTLRWVPIMPGVDRKTVSKMGICVEKCPQPYFNKKAKRNADPEKVVKRFVTGYTERKWPIQYPVLYTSTPVFGRCVPVYSDPDTYRFLVKEKLEKFKAFESLSESVASALETIQECEYIILATMATSLFMCLFYGFVLQFVVGPVVYMTLMFLQFVLVAMAYFFYTEGIAFESNPDAYSHYYAYYKMIGIACMVASGMYFVVACFLLGRIRIGVEIIEMASKVVLRLPDLMLVPIVVAIAFLILTACFAANLVLLGTMGTEHQERITMPSFAGKNFPGQTVTSFDANESKGFMSYYLIFGYIWWSHFLVEIKFMIAAFCGVFWYFSTPGNDKHLEPGTVRKAIYNTLRYHLGTLALGSFLIAVTNVLRWIWMKVEEFFKSQYGEPQGGLARYIFGCIQCIIACIEKLVKYISRNAYIMTCIKGTDFCASAGSATSMIVENVMTVSAINLISDWVIIFLKIFIVLSNILVAMVLIWIKDQDLPPNEEGSNYIPVLILIAFFTYIIASIFLGVFHCIVDSILVCFCYDDRMNNGKDLPYFFTDDLATLLNKRNEYKSTLPDSNTSKYYTTYE